MIADALGVTKAVVYHQFKTKDEITFRFLAGHRVSRATKRRMVAHVNMASRWIV